MDFQWLFFLQKTCTMRLWSIRCWCEDFPYFRKNGSFLSLKFPEIFFRVLSIQGIANDQLEPNCGWLLHSNKSSSFIQNQSEALSRLVKQSWCASQSSHQLFEIIGEPKTRTHTCTMPYAHGNFAHITYKTKWFWDQRLFLCGKCIDPSFSSSLIDELKEFFLIF